jgi:hypothetical protein
MAAAGRHPARRIMAGLGVLGFAAAFCVFYLDSTSKWWYEDDPLQFSAASAISNPLDIFLDPQILRRWGTGASLVPMHVLSYWLDTHLFGISPTAARLHNLASTILACWLLYVALTCFGVDRGVAAFAAGLWLWLPATIAVHDYLGTRHYIEGLGWSLAACYFLVRICHEPPGAPASRDTAFLLILTVAAILSKEIYLTTLLAFIFLYSFWHRRYGLSAMAVALLAGYYWYRIVMLGSGAYPHPDWSVREYARYLWVLPYTFSASPWGWAYYAALAGGAVWAFTREPRSASAFLILMVVVFAAGLAATYPTAPAVLLTYETPGTWYRAVFILQTLALIGGASLLGRYAAWPIRIAALCGLIVILAPGVDRTRKYWEGRFARSEVEGRFYLAHPEKLVYSEEDASWFLPGLERLYGIGRTHYVSKNELSGAHPRKMVQQFSTIWRQRESSWVRDEELYALIRQRTLAAP